MISHTYHGNGIYIVMYSPCVYMYLQTGLSETNPEIFVAFYATDGLDPISTLLQDKSDKLAEMKYIHHAVNQSLLKCTMLYGTKTKVQCSTSIRLCLCLYVARIQMRTKYIHITCLA